MLAHRESAQSTKGARKLPLCDNFDYKNLISSTSCWKQEKKRIKSMLDAFSLSSCKYATNIGWKGGLFAQMCGHYLHFDCYNSYKQTLDQSSTYQTDPLSNSFSRNSNVEYACPLCRQVANCVLPVSPTTYSSTKSTIPPPPPPPPRSEATASASTSSDSFIISSVSNSPAKLWILSSLADKQKQLETTASSAEASVVTHFTDLNEEILYLLKTRPFSNPITNSKVLTQCKNDALTLITLTTPVEFRYIDRRAASMYTATLGTSTGFATAAAAAVHLVDDDIALFTTSVLRSQLEIDLMLKQQRNENFALATINFKKKRSCFRK